MLRCHVERVSVAPRQPRRGMLSVTRSFIDLVEDICPLPKKAPTENSDANTCENSPEKTCENSSEKTCENSSEKTCENSSDANTCPNYCRKAPKTCENSSEKTSKKRWSDVTRASLVTNSDYFPQKVVRGSFHQGDARFGWNRNRQCAVNSITAVMVSVLKDVLTWTTEDLNAVLFHGDELYTSMRLQGQINDRTGLGHIFCCRTATTTHT
ncbi:uncharacterized protein LOC113092313 [Carassius auratus]|uniref:Uncharacterized protein LOC113092313 n=1 Tax=Carassius auratus TaxID=7957 RepID=A0A6P6NYE7_CARAU|nr:uncharacterized protein LOC113092313 [Carassius auratus]